MGYHVGIYFCFCQDTFKVMKIITLRVLPDSRMKIKDLKEGDIFSFLSGYYRMNCRFIRNDANGFSSWCYVELYGRAEMLPKELVVDVLQNHWRVNTKR